MCILPVIVIKGLTNLVLGIKYFYRPSLPTQSPPPQSNRNVNLAGNSKKKAQMSAPTSLNTNQWI